MASWWRRAWPARGLSQHGRGRPSPCPARVRLGPADRPAARRRPAARPDVPAQQSPSSPRKPRNSWHIASTYLDRKGCWTLRYGDIDASPWRGVVGSRSSRWAISPCPYPFSRGPPTLPRSGARAASAAARRRRRATRSSPPKRRGIKARGSPRTGTVRLCPGSETTRPSPTSTMKFLVSVGASSAAECARCPRGPSRDRTSEV